MKRKIVFTDEHVALIKAMNFQQIDVDEILKSFDQYNKEVLIKDDITGRMTECTLGDIFDRYRINIDSLYGIDNFNLWGGTYIWEQISYIIGIHDHIIKGTEEDPSGPKFTEEDMEHMRDLDSFIVTHLKDIFDIILQLIPEGLEPNVTYWCYDYEGIWHKETSDK